MGNRKTLAVICAVIVGAMAVFGSVTPAAALPGDARVKVVMPYLFAAEGEAFSGSSTSVNFPGAWDWSNGGQFVLDTVSCDDLPAGMSLAGEGVMSAAGSPPTSTLTVTGTPAPGSNGRYDLCVSFTDDFGHEDQAEFTLEVSELPLATLSLDVSRAFQGDVVTATVTDTNHNWCQDQAGEGYSAHVAFINAANEWFFFPEGTADEPDISGGLGSFDPSTYVDVFTFAVPEWVVDGEYTVWAGCVGPAEDYQQPGFGTGNGPRLTIGVAAPAALPELAATGVSGISVMIATAGSTLLLLFGILVMVMAPRRSRRHSAK